MDAERAARLGALKSKSVRPKQNYIHIALALTDQVAEWKLSPYERYQKIQAWRSHQPTITERKNLKIPHATSKLDLEDLPDVLILCGGNQHIEFSIEEMNEIESVLENFKEKLKILQEYFGSLSLDSSTFHIPGHHVKHFLKLREHSHKSSENKSFLGSLFHSRKSSDKDSPNSVNSKSAQTETQSPVAALGVEGAAAGPGATRASESHELTMMESLLDTLHLKPPDVPSAMEEKVLTFHHYADEVQLLLRKIQKIVMCKYQQRPVQRNFHDNMDSINDTKKDWWIEILIKKYRTEYLTPFENVQIQEQEKANPSLSSSNDEVITIETEGDGEGEGEGEAYPHSYLPPLAIFATFLSCCLLNEIDCTAMEQEALLKLLHVSQDFHSLSTRHGTPLLSEGYQDYILEHTQEYWINRIIITLAEIAHFEINESTSYSMELLNEVRHRYYGQ